MGITNCFQYASICNISIDTIQQQADSESIINDIDLTMFEIVTNEDIVKDIMTSKQVEPDNNTSEFDYNFGTVQLISKACDALLIFGKSYYTKYEDTDA